MPLQVSECEIDAAVLVFAAVCKQKGSVTRLLKTIQSTVVAFVLLMPWRMSWHLFCNDHVARVQKNGLVAPMGFQLVIYYVLETDFSHVLFSIQGWNSNPGLRLGIPGLRESGSCFSYPPCIGSPR